MKELIILGGAGIGLTVASIAEQEENIAVLGFLNDVVPVGERIGKFKSFPVIGTTNDITRYLDDPDVLFFVAYVGMQNEKQVYEKVMGLNIPVDRFYTAIDKRAVYPEGYCKLGNGILLTALSQVGVDVTLSDNVMLFANAYVGHNAFLDRFAHVASNAVVGANVHVGKAVHVGTNATIREKVTIGDYSLIGSGAVVLNDVPPKTIVAGAPAKVVKYIEE